MIGLEQAGPQLTLRVPPGPDGEDLAPYERRVLGRVRALAHGGVLPAQALADEWHRVEVTCPGGSGYGSSPASLICCS